MLFQCVLYGDLIFLFDRSTMLFLVPLSALRNDPYSMYVLTHMIYSEPVHYYSMLVKSIRV
jgi:hypothetical protein